MNRKFEVVIPHDPRYTPEFFARFKEAILQLSESFGPLCVSEPDRDETTQQYFTRAMMSMRKLAVQDDMPDVLSVELMHAVLRVKQVQRIYRGLNRARSRR